MKYILLIFSIFYFGCVDRDVEEFEKNCPYDLKRGGHFFQIPITITPNKKTYAIGDTLRVSAIFTDSIYDFGTGLTFKIMDLPIKPITQLYRFYDGLSWDAGYRVNDWYIDSIYFTKYNYSSRFADAFLGHMTYNEGQYAYEYYIVLKEKGRYIMNMFDNYQENLGSGNADSNGAEYNISFEGRCPTLPFFICNMIEGDNHLDSFEKELVFIDNEILGGKLTFVDNYLGFLGNGSLAVEWNGFYGFEVK